jgi:hypothetical protein
MKHLILSILIVLLIKFSAAQNGNLPELITDKYAILKSTPEDARSIMLRISLKNKDSTSHQGYLKVDIRDQEGQLSFQNEKKIALDTAKTNEFKYDIVFENPDEYSIHYTYLDESGQFLEKTFSWETKPVNFFYSFATPHRLTVALPDNSNKTLLDLYTGKLEISWTYDNLIYYPFDAFRVPRSDWKLSIQPLINDKPFSYSKWERSDGYLPVLKNTYEEKDITVILEVAGADSAAIVKIILINKSNTSQRIKIPCVCPGGWKGYNPGWIDNTLPTDYLLAGWDAPADKILILGIGADYFPVDPVITTQLNMIWELKPGETRTGWLIRPYNSFARDAAYMKTTNWEKKFNQSKEIWKTLINRTCRLIIPDPGIVNGFYASVADIFIMREPVGQGYLGITPGTEAYRSCPTPFEPAIATVALDQIGLHKEAELGYRVNWDIQALNGDWSEPGGWAHLMWGASGYKAWALMEHFLHTRDTAFLEKRCPQMLICSKWQDMERRKTRLVVNGEKSLTYGLMPRGMGDGGLMDGNSYYGIFYTHNIWAVFEDSLAYRAALILNRREDAKELKDIYERSKSDLITAMERGAIGNKNGARRLSSLPGKNSGSCWGLLNAIYPTGILPDNHELMNNTINYIEERMSPGGIPVHTGWMPNGMWVAITLNDFAEAHLARNEGDAANAFLYSTLNHGTPLYTWCEERGQDPDTKETSGDLQHLWTPEAAVRCTRDIILMEEGNTLHLLRGIARGWLAGGEYIGIEKASSHFGEISFKVRFDKNKSQLTGEIHFPKENHDFKTILHCPLPEKMKVVNATGANILTDGSGIRFDKCTGDISFTATVK